MADTKYPKRIVLPLTQQHYDKLAKAAQQQDRPVVWLLRRCIEQSDFADVAEAHSIRDRLAFGEEQ